jgi:diketogulonate reductase-like aldo/keto reductase
MKATPSRRVFGSTGVAVPVIGQGTWNMERDGRATAVPAIRRGLDLGMTHIDTAEIYGNGAVEEIVGEAIAGRRGDVFLVSKVWPNNATRKGTVTACERSLRRLRTDFLDCYLLHWPSSHPLAGIVEAFEQLVAAGKIKSWGVSNFNEDEIDEAVAIAGPGRVACNQVLYHLGERAIEHYVVPRCERHGIAVVGYTPFGHRSSRGSKVLDEIAAARRATPRQVTLAFLTRRPSLFAIPKASQIPHVEENAGGAGLTLTADEIGRLEAAFPAGRARRGDVPML